MAMKIKGSQKNFSRPLSNDLHREFIDWLGGLGVEPDPKKGLVVGGEIGRAYTTVDGRRKQNAWYQVWFDQDRPYGHAERYDIGSLGSWKAEGGDIPKLTKEQKAEIERAKEQARLAQEVEQTKAAMIDAPPIRAKSGVMSTPSADRTIIRPKARTSQ